MTNNEYDQYVGKKMPKSSLFIKALRAFIAGGAICVIAQIILNLLLNFGIKEDDAATFTSLSMIFIGALLTGLNVYDDLAKFAGAGTIVPITGFANSIVSPAMEFKSEGYVLGLGAKMFIIAGPVLVYGISTSVICGLIMVLIKGMM